MRLPIRIAGIILDKNKVLLVHRIKNGEEYYVFPGGGLEDTDKSHEAGLLREIAEETTTVINIEKLVYEHDYTTSKGLYFLCNFVSGEPKLGEFIEKERMSKGNNDFI